LYLITAKVLYLGLESGSLSLESPGFCTFSTKSLMPNSPLQLLSKQGDRLLLSRSAARGSALFQDMLENAPLDQPISLPNLTTTVLELVVEYLNYYANSALRPSEIQKPLRSNDFAELVTEWEDQFVDKPHEVVFELIIAARYLCIPGLLDLAAARVAGWIKGKTPEEIRRRFNIVNDFTPEEEQQIRDENKWAEEL